MLLICCLCDKVCEEALSQPNENDWYDLHANMSRNQKRGGTILSYTCCPRCFESNPLARAFRTRREAAFDTIVTHL